MRKIIYILLLLPICMAACRKDASNKTGNKADDYEGYIIQGKMKNVIATDGGIEQPFVMIFMTDNKARLVNLNGETTLNYSVQEGKLVLDDNGYFNIVNKQITDWVIAGLNITKATLKTKPSSNQLRGKKFGGMLKYSEVPFTIETKIDFDANADQFSFPGDAEPTQYPFTIQGNVAGFLYDTPSKSSLFFMMDNGKLEYANYSPDSGIAVTALSPR